MTYKTFLEVTLQLQKQERVIDNLYKNNVDLNEFVDPYHKIVTILIEEIYGKEGLDWWSWFCYENDFGQKGLEAWDENKNPICFSFESLWEFLEANKPVAEKV
jgi:hypothetical protein